MALHHLNHITQLRKANHFQLTPLFAREERVQLRNKDQDIACCGREFHTHEYRKFAEFARHNATSNLSGRMTIDNRDPIQTELRCVRHGILSGGATARSSVNVQVYQHRNPRSSGSHPRPK